MRSPKFFDLQVSLVVDGSHLAEYDDEDSDETNVNQLTKYVEATSGANFTVKIQLPRQLPSPVPLEDRDPNDLSPEEARELVRRLRERQIEIKQEFKTEKRSRDSTVIDDDEDDDVTIASENDRRNKRPRLAGRDSGVEIVDLTDD